MVELITCCRSIEASSCSGLTLIEPGRQERPRLDHFPRHKGREHGLDSFVPAAEEILKRLKKLRLRSRFRCQLRVPSSFQRAKESAYDKGTLQVRPDQFKWVNPHGLRHGGVSFIYEQGSSVSDACVAANHSSMATSERYRHTNHQTAERLMSMKSAQEVKWAK